MEKKIDYEKETEIIYGQDTCCGAYDSESGCCPFITNNQKEE